MVDMRLLGVREVEAAFDRVVAQVSAANIEIVRESAALVESAAKRNFEGSHARGMPHVGGDKPNVVSGTLRRSVRHTPIIRDGLAGAMSSVGPSVLYGRRVELGFTGADAAGRTYHQKPYPYFEPAVKDNRLAMQEIARIRWARAMRGR